MNTAIDLLTRKLETERQVLASIKASNERQPESADWYEQNAIPKSEKVIAEIEEALTILRRESSK